MNLPLELVDKILQYDGRMKYRKGAFVNIIHPADSRFFIVEPVITKKQNIFKSMDIINVGRIINYKFAQSRFYFEFDFDNLPGVGLCYDYYWGTSLFEICYYDLRNDWKQIRTKIPD